MRYGKNSKSIIPVLSRILISVLLAASLEALAAERQYEGTTDHPDSAYALGLLYRADVLSNISGGLKRGTMALGNLDATADFNLERMAGWSGMTAGVHAIWSHGSKPNTHLVGSIQGVDNIEVETNTAKIFQV
jgi:porin